MPLVAIVLVVVVLSFGFDVGFVGVLVGLFGDVFDYFDYVVDLLGLFA